MFHWNRDTKIKQLIGRDCVMKSVNLGDGAGQCCQIMFEGQLILLLNQGQWKYDIKASHRLYYFLSVLPCFLHPAVY